MGRLFWLLFPLGLTACAADGQPLIDSRTFRDAAIAYSESQEQKDRERDDWDDEERMRPAEGRSAGGGVAVAGPKVINVGGDSYVARGRERTSQSGFFYAGVWYERSGELLEGTLFVAIDRDNGQGFWQDSKYWVPADSAPSDDNDRLKPAGAVPEVINLRDETYLRSGRSQTSGSGFWYRDHWYQRSSHYERGTVFIEGSRSDGEGFFQHSRYWVPAQ